MINFLQKLSDNGIYLDIKEGKLKLYSEDNQVDENLLSEIKQKKNEIVAHLIEYGVSHVKQENLIQSVTLSNGYPLSASQKRLWVLSQIKENSVAYNIPSQVTLNGDYDIKLIIEAINSVLDRHEILRTVFKEDNQGEIKQWIIEKENLEFKIDYKDFKSISNAFEIAQLFIKDDSFKAFDLERGPLFRVTIFQISENEYLLYYNMHHIISDGWSMDVLNKDIFLLYDAYKKGEQPQLPVLKTQYKDYAVWQNERLICNIYEDSLKYWLEVLSGELPRITLPTNKTRPSYKTNRGERISTKINAENTQQLRLFLQEQGGSLFSGLLAIWNILLYLYTSQKDIILGIPVSGREHPDLENQIGYYVNTIVLKNTINPEDNFVNFYRSVKENLLETFSHQQYPFDSLIENLDLEYTPSLNPIFDIMVSFQSNYEKNEEKFYLSDDIDTLNYYENVVSKFDVDVFFRESEENISLDITYNTDVYDRDIIVELINHFKLILPKLLHCKDDKLGSIDYLSEEVKEDLLFTFNDTEIKYQVDETIIDVFQKNVANFPNHVAVEFEGKMLTYFELEEESNQFAHFLSNQFDVLSEEPVAIQLEHNEFLIIAILGILKLGAFYIPIDPSMPEKKIEDIKRDSNYKICIKEIELEKFRLNKKKYSKRKIDCQINPVGLAYTIYTSGSTGKPKGVMIGHKSLMNYLNWGIAYYLKENMLNHNFGLFTTMAFDLTVTSVFLPLMTGNKLIIFNSKEDISTNIKRYIENDISCIKLTPAHINLIDNLSIQSCKLELAIVGGDTLHRNHIDTLRKINPSIRIVNEYGPTEATVGCVVYDVKTSDEIYIGKPIYNSKVYILNEFNGLQPKGVIGELGISGDCLAKGYLNQLGLTKEKFIKHPFIEGEQLYKTGDLARWLPNGEIDFIGRVDNQVKIRGYRIELAEVETHMLSKESISDVAVVVEDINQENELVAYFTSITPQLITEIREFLSNRLPNYMIPTKFVQIEMMPLTVNGKIDKKKLKNSPKIKSLFKSKTKTSLNVIERKLVEIWETILQIDPNSFDIDDFFTQLGGHSLKAMKLISSIHKEFDVKLSLKQIFENPTIRTQSKLIEGSKKQIFNRIPKVLTADNYDLSYEQRRIWLLSSDEEKSIAYNMPFHFEIEGEIDFEIFEKAVYATINRHEILRTVFREDQNGEIKQWINPVNDLNFKLDYIDLTNDKEKDERIKKIINEKYYSPFDLENGPILRIGFLILERKKQILFYVMHHIISDGNSMNILTNDVMSFYNAYKRKHEPELPALNIQYKDYAAWQNDKTTNSNIEDQKLYWQEIFKDGVPKIKLPFEKLRPKKFKYTGTRVQFTLAKKIKEGLENITRENSGSMYVTFVFLVNLIVHKYTGSKKIMLGSSFSTRIHSELENQIGFYVNNLPVVTTIDEEFTLLQLYEAVKNSILEVNNDSWFPLEKLIESIDYKHDQTYSGLFNFLVEFHPISDYSESEQNSREYNFVFTENVPCQFDFSLEFYESTNEIKCEFVYNNSLFDKIHIELFIERFLILLNELISNNEIFKSKRINEITFDVYTQMEGEMLNSNLYEENF